MSDERVELEKISAPDKVGEARRGYPRTNVYPEAYVNGYGYGQGYGDEFGSGGGEGEKDFTIILHDVWRAVRKYKWLIAIITVLVTAIVAIEVSRVRPSYTAFTLIEIRKDSSISASVADSDPQNIVIINTKMLMFDSQPLLKDVVVKKQLHQYPNFFDLSAKRSYWETVKGIFVNQPSQDSVNSASVVNESLEPNGEAAGATAENKPLDRFVNVLKGRKKAEHLPNTQAIRVSFTHTDPEIAKRAVEGLTECFIDRNLQTKLTKFDAAKDWLDRSTRELQTQVQKAEQGLNNFTREKSLFAVDPDGRDTLTNIKVSRLQEQVARVETELLRQRLLYDEAKQGGVMQLPQAASDPRITGLQTRKDDLSRESARLSVDYGPEHPRVKEVQQQMGKVQEQIDVSRHWLEERIKADYERALNEYQSLQQQLEQAKSEAAQKDQAAIQYSILKQKLDTAKSLYAEFLQKKSQADLEVAQQQSNISVLRPAEAPKSPDGIYPPFTVLLGFLFSLAAGVGLAFILDRFDNTVKNVADVSRHAQLPTIGIIPSVSTGRSGLFRGRGNISITDKAAANGSAPQHGVSAPRFLLPQATRRFGSESPGLTANQMVLLDDQSVIAESYRALRTSVLLSHAGTPPKTILVTSGQSGEGKTTTVINTAISLAQLGASVLIIDADLRKPSAHKGLGVELSQGLSTYLSRDVGLEKMIQKVKIPNLSLLPCGPIPPNPAELLSSEKMKNMLGTLAGRYDHILIDSPPMMYVTDPVILATLVEGVILVVHGGRTKHGVVRQSCHLLATVGAKIFGVVLNNVKNLNQLSHDYAYYLYHSQYSPDRHEERVSDIL